MKPVEAQVAPLSVVRKSPPDAKLSDADTTKVCGSLGEAHNRGPRKNAGRPAGGVKPGRAVVSRAQRAADVIARFAVPNCDHILICTVLYNFNVSYPVEIADLIHLRPASPGISAAPDCTFESCYSEVCAPEQDQIGIVETEAHRVEIGFVQGTLVRTKWRPASVVLAAVQAFLSYSRWPG